ncbi:hypothetical protein L798_04868 [Zootermopsis nevadensis]|uniref:Uncharacterized protein n=1 Tax=Zootermopsis nevadensis TaxID=136037 RepID=A0A067RCP7_ZOONE|nr:hypothetical protein L798_04868 [Zootermopsis nevadensis]
MVGKDERAGSHPETECDPYPRSTSAARNLFQTQDRIHPCLPTRRQQDYKHGQSIKNYSNPTVTIRFTYNSIVFSKIINHSLSNLSVPSLISAVVIRMQHPRKFVSKTCPNS